jgi:hypothetical protein
MQLKATWRIGNNERTKTRFKGGTGEHITTQTSDHKSQNTERRKFSDNTNASSSIMTHDDVPPALAEVELRGRVPEGSVQQDPSMQIGAVTQTSLRQSLALPFDVGADVSLNQKRPNVFVMRAHLGRKLSRSSNRTDVSTENAINSAINAAM